MIARMLHEYEEREDVEYSITFDAADNMEMAENAISYLLNRAKRWSCSTGPHIEVERESIDDSVIWNFRGDRGLIDDIALRIFLHMTEICDGSVMLHRYPNLLLPD